MIGDGLVDLVALDKRASVHQREGTILPIQPYEQSNALNTRDLIKSSITLLVYPDNWGVAEGTLYIDDDG